MNIKNRNKKQHNLIQKAVKPSPVASIIIVNWNTKADLLECLNSIFSQKSADSYEIIVVDNGSTDGSIEAVEREYPKVCMIQNEENLGFSGGNNIGIEAAHGENVFFVNSDVVVLDGCFEKMLTYLEEGPDIGIIGPKVLTVNGDIQRSCMSFPTLWNTFCRACGLDTMFPGTRLFGGKLMTYWEHNTLREVDVINGCFWLVRGEALNDVGLLDEDFFMYGEDVDWCQRYGDRQWKVVFFPDAKVIHKGGMSAAKAPKRFYIEMFKSEVKYWKKYHSKLKTVAYVFILLLHQLIRIFTSHVTLIKHRNYSKYKELIATHTACTAALIRTILQ